ncbi:MAG: hypothetical protein Q8P31_02310 [Bacillota bacterium]|nr:hypothetical protein [Bacillota bacterium]
MVKLDCTRCGEASYSASAEANACPYCGHKLIIGEPPAAPAKAR